MRGDLVAEPAADVLGDDAQLVEPDAHRRPHHDRREARELVVREHRPLAGAAVVLDERAVALERRRVEAVEVELVDLDDVVGLGERRVDVPPLPHARVREVAAAVLVEHGRPVGERLARVDDDLERVVVDHHELGRVAGQLAGLGDDGDDGLAEIAHLADGERVVLDVAAGRSGDLEERIGQDRHLVARQRPEHAGKLERGGDVDRGDRGVRVRRAHEVQVAHPLALDVVEEDALALDEPPVLLARDALTDRSSLRQGSGLGLDRGQLRTPFTDGDDRFDDVPVARAAADVALQRDLDLVLGRPGILLEQRGGAHQHPGRAVPALETVVVAERLLQRSQLPVAAREALDGRDRRAVGLDGQHAAALDRIAPELHRARAAAARIAADVSAGQVEVVAEEVDEQE